MTNLTTFVKLLILGSMSYTYKKGFTLIELLIVMAILGILATLGFGNFMSSRTKAKDAARKSDLQMVAKSLEAYANDYKGYPNSDTGKIVVAGNSIAWGESFKDVNTTYASKLPSDPSGYEYYYEKIGSGYYLYTYLENTQDPLVEPAGTYAGKTCGSVECNYRISSSNL